MRQRQNRGRCSRPWCPGLILQLIGTELVDESDAAAFLTHVQEHTAPFLLDLRHGGGELLAAVAAQRAEGVTGETFGMHAHEHVLAIGNVALDEGNVMLAVEIVDKTISGEIAVLRRHFHAGSLLNKIFVGLAIVLQILDGDEAEAPFLRQVGKLGGAHHGAVFAHDLTAEANFLQARQAAEIDGGFGVAIALEHAVFFASSGTYAPDGEILRLCFLVHAARAVMPRSSAEMPVVVERDRWKR